MMDYPSNNIKDILIPRNLDFCNHMDVCKSMLMREISLDAGMSLDPTIQQVPAMPYIPAHTQASISPEAWTVYSKSASSTSNPLFY
jgi:hypothetical protein